MNIQIFGTKKNFDSKKAERYFKERGIKYQFIDMKKQAIMERSGYKVKRITFREWQYSQKACLDRVLIEEQKKIYENFEAAKFYADIPEYRNNTKTN